MDAVALLIRDHDLVKKLFKDYETMGAGNSPATRRDLAQQIIRELLVHERIEEDVFYPAFKDAADREGRKRVAEAREEHHVVDLIIGELEGVDLDAPDFDAKMKVLMDNVRHHIDEEEGVMFPDARKLLASQLDGLGEVMMELKEALSRQVKARREMEH